MWHETQDLYTASKQLSAKYLLIVMEKNIVEKLSAP